MVSEHVKSEFFDGLSTREVAAIVAEAKRRHFPARRVVISQGSPADHFFLLVKGRARHFYATSEGRKVLLLWLTPGEIFGAAAFISKPYLYQVSTEMVLDSEVLVWERDVIRGFASRFPRLLENAICRAAAYLAWYQATHVALTCHSAPQRLEQVLKGLAATIGQKVPGGIELDVTNEELASASNITPFTASRLLSRWQKRQRLVKGRGRVLLRSPGWLPTDPLPDLET